jgi:uncharacterized repeat protein (TIGR03803 family)
MEVRRSAMRARKRVVFRFGGAPSKYVWIRNGDRFVTVPRLLSSLGLIALALGLGSPCLAEGSEPSVLAALFGPQTFGRAPAQPTKSAAETLLYSFGASGIVPFGGVIQDADGALYGMTHGGGGQGCGGGGCGTVYKLTPAGSSYTASVLHSFTAGSDGATPLFGSLILDSKGVLYGATQYGGTSSACGGPSQPNGCGVVFKLTPSGKTYKESILHSFAGGNDGAFPLSSLIADSNGALYGTTSQGGGSSNNCPSFGGASGCGTIFKIASAGTKYTESLLYAFKGGTDGAIPDGGLVADASGALYGTTELGGGGACSVSGVPGCGTVFKLTPAGKGYSESVLHGFANAPDGAFPYDTLVLNSKTGALYGTTINGGTNVCSGYGCGTVFSVTPSGNGFKESVLYDFDGTHGGLPVAGLAVKGSELYGTTLYGGPPSCSFSAIPGCGVVFSIKPSGGGFKVVYDFVGMPTDGGGAYGTLFLGVKNTFFGTTYLGGASNIGSVYSLIP